MSSRIDNTLKNARWTLFFNALLLVVNLVSREVFITHLGNNFLGLAATITSYIGFLNLAELGISSALTQALYKPIVEGDKSKITATVSIIAFLFRRVGIIIGIAGAALCVALPWLIDNPEVSLTQIYTTFLTMLAVTMLSYLVNYKQILMLAAQKNYVVTKIYNTVLVTKFVLQIALLYLFNMGYMAWLACELLTAIAYAVWLEMQIRNHYPHLKSSYAQGKIAFKENNSIMRNARNIFGQSIAGKVLLSSDNIVIQNILGLAQVTFYTNYTMLTGRITSLLVGTLSASAPAIGHIVASGDKTKTQHVFNQTNALYFFLGAIVAFGFYTCVNPLLDLWLTEKLIYGQLIVLLLSINLFITIVGRPAEYFLAAYALFHDVWAAWTQMAINLILSIFLTIHYGIVGVVAGTAISTCLLTLVWRPYFLCSQGLKIPALNYWFTIIKFIILTAISWLSVMYLINLDLFVTPDSWPRLIIYAITTTATFTAIYAALSLGFSSGTRSLFELGKNFLKKKL